MTANAVKQANVSASDPPPLAVYIHFPWCLRKCPYCDFSSVACEASSIPHKRYADAIVAELDARTELLATRRVASVYFGGGTPSLWDPEQLGRVLHELKRRAPCRSEMIEVTVECNPSSLSPERASRLSDLGVNRLSIGVQSLDRRRLELLGRLHDVGEALDAVSAALQAGTRVSADLIHGVGGVRCGDNPQSALQAASEATELARLGVGHVSTYCLTVAANTPFGVLQAHGMKPAVDPDTSADTFVAVSEALRAADLEHYEISNFARPGEQSRHNLAYWQGQDYLGVGAAAYGTISQSDGHGLRYRNSPNPADYLSNVYAPESCEPLDPDTRLRERIMLGLRTQYGVDLAKAAADLGVDPFVPSRDRAIEELIARGRLSRTGSCLVIPHSAWLHADSIAAALF